MLVGAASVLAARRDEVPGTVRFAFQPGEEGFHGARHMIDEGALDGIDGVFAIHVTPNLPSGTVATRGGPILASADELEITVRGRGGHASSPYLANDPMPVAAEIVQALQVFATRRINPFDPVIITITKMRAGSTNNVIPETVQMLGTLRAVSDGSRARALAGIERVVTNIASAHEMGATVDIQRGYAPTLNDPRFAAFVTRVGADLLGAERSVEFPTPAMGAEDFGYMTRERHGAIAFLGVCPPGSTPMHAASCHSNRMMLDEDALPAGVALHCAVALSYLAEGVGR
jgi:hippurate hydrolase